MTKFFERICIISFCIKKKNNLYWIERNIPVKIRLIKRDIFPKQFCIIKLLKMNISIRKKF